MKRLFCMFVTCLIGLTTLPASVFAQQESGPITFSQQELDQLLAPIALYPDPLLSDVLMAATYPLETVQAARFVRQYPALKGDALARAVEGQPWDQSVKALTQFPSVLMMMDDQLAWTQKLGDAFLSQQDAVMDTVQSLRAKALAAGTLRSNSQQRVVMHDGLIDIEPYAPDVIYVPYYNPTVVYGGWWWPDRPPMVWMPPPMYQPDFFGDAIVAGIAFGIGINIIDTVFFDARPDWRRHRFVVHDGRRHDRPTGPGITWTHDPSHRQGVAYRDATTRDRFQPAPTGSINRNVYRGHVSNIPSPASPVTVVTPRAGVPVRPRPSMPAAPTARPAQPVQPVQPVQRIQPVQPVVRPPTEQIHPFIPSGPASVTQSHSERGRASREESRPADGRARRK